MLTFSSISASVGRESEGTRAGEALRRYSDRRERGWLRVLCVGRIALSGLVRVGEGFIVSIMAWPNDNGCRREKSEGRRGFTLPWAGPALHPVISGCVLVLRSFVVLGFAPMLERVVRRELRIFPSPGQGEDRR